MAVTYPAYKGLEDLFVIKPGTFVAKETADGTVYSVTIQGTKFAFDGASNIPRGTEINALIPSIPAGYYVDERVYKEILYGATSDESCIEMELVCREPNNMGDGIVSATEPEVYTVDWEMDEVPLQYFETRYPAASMKSFVIGNQTLWGMIQQWINAESAEVQASIYQVIIANGTGAQPAIFEDFCVMYLRGVFTREVFYPVLVRTKRTNTAESANPTPGQIDTSIPSGFNSIKPTGTWTYRQMPTRIERIGRTGGYNIIDRWIGDPAWDSRLYGTTAQQQGNYQSLG